MRILNRGTIVTNFMRLTVLLILPAVSWGDDSARKAGEIVLEPAAMVSPEGTVDFELGTLYVPENRSDPGSRLIGVGFARFKGREGAGALPTVHLPGGPGNSYLMGLMPGNNYRRFVLAELFTRAGDVVFIDQRGFSTRGENLKFRGQTPGFPAGEPESLARSTAAFVEMVKAAVADSQAKGIDLRGYTVLECADDVNDLRKALGYPQITLVGESFGSQWSFAIMRRHPEIVARAVLSGVEPLDCGYDMPSHIFAALQRISWQADQDPKLAPYLPAGGLMAAARAVLERLQKATVQVPVKSARNGETVTVTLGPEDFQESLLGLGRTTAGPAFLLSQYHGHYDAWARMVLASRRSREMEMPLIGPLIDTSLGVTPRRRHLLRTDPASDYLGHWNFDAYLATADIWPTADVGDEFRTEIVCRIPVLFVHGDWDIQTPIENLLTVTPYFPNSRVLVAVHGRHAELRRVLPLVPAVLEFVQTGNTSNLPAKVVLPVPQFDVPNFPPPADKPATEGK